MATLACWSNYIFKSPHPLALEDSLVPQSSPVWETRMGLEDAPQELQVTQGPCDSSWIIPQICLCWVPECISVPLGFHPRGEEGMSAETFKYEEWTGGCLQRKTKQNWDTNCTGHWGVTPGPGIAWGDPPKLLTISDMENYILPGLPGPQCLFKELWLPMQLPANLFPTNPGCWLHTNGMLASEESLVRWPLEWLPLWESVRHSGSDGRIRTSDPPACRVCGDGARVFIPSTLLWEPRSSSRNRHNHNYFSFAFWSPITWFA